MRALNDGNEEIVLGSDEREEMFQEVLNHFLHDKPSEEVIRARQARNEISLDAVSQINRLTGKTVSAKRPPETKKVEEAPRTVVCSGDLCRPATKKGGFEEIQVLVRSVGGVAMTPPQTKYFRRKNDKYPWADKDGNVFKTEAQIKEEERLARSYEDGLDNPTDLAERVARAREELMRVAGGGEQQKEQMCREILSGTPGKNLDNFNTVMNTVITKEMLKEE